MMEGHCISFLLSDMRRLEDGMSFLKSKPDADMKTVLRMAPTLGVPFAEYHEALLRGPSPFSVAERELIGAYVSALNACDFCAGEHAAVAEAFGMPGGLLDALMDDFDAAPVDDKLRPVLVFVKKLNDTPARVVQGDVDKVYAAGWDEMALYHAVSICALFNMNNRIINGMGIPPHGADKLVETVARLKEHGYGSTAAFIKGEWQDGEK
jgi:uncharacterized peroxidase-related enzyme